MNAQARIARSSRQQTPRQDLTSFALGRNRVSEAPGSECGTPALDLPVRPVMRSLIDIIANNAHQPADRLQYSALRPEYSGRGWRENSNPKFQTTEFQYFLTSPPPKFWTSGAIFVFQISPHFQRWLQQPHYAKCAWQAVERNNSTQP
jgi:hypothetical protein